MTELERSLWVNQLKKYLDSSDERIELPFHPLATWQEIFEECGIKPDIEGFETNGWQVDFFWDLKDSNGGKHLFQGGLFYGDFEITESDE